MAACSYYEWYIFVSAVSAGILANENILLVANKRQSSPSHITATKGLSVSLHWNYSYKGDGWHRGLVYYRSKYEEQTIGFKCSSQPRMQALAKRTGQNGDLTLESPVPAPFKGRLEIIAENNTLILHDLRYNDSTCHLTSTVTVNTEVSDEQLPHEFHLKPIVSLTVNGIPDFIKLPPSTLEVDENSKLQLSVYMDGHPKPSVYFKWSHLTKSSKVPGVRLYPYIYSSIYTISSIDGGYCGRVLQTTIKNAIGSSSTTDTMVIILLNLEQSYYLKAERLAKSKCIVVKWKRVKSGKCYVTYSLKFRNSSAKIVDTAIGYNIEQVKICHPAIYASTTYVELSISFKRISKTVNATVSDEQSNTTQHTTLSIPNTNVENGVSPTSSENASTSIDKNGRPPVNKSDDVAIKRKNEDIPEKKMINAGENSTGFTAIVIVVSLVLVVMVIHELVNRIRRPG